LTITISPSAGETTIFLAVGGILSGSRKKFIQNKINKALIEMMVYLIQGLFSKQAITINKIEIPAQNKNVFRPYFVIIIKILLS
jgi:hypothetical protein